jgi:hypothetical protein
MPKFQNAKNTFWCRFQLLGVGVPKYFTTEIAKCQNVKLQHGVSGICDMRNRKMLKGTIVSLEDSKEKKLKSR